MNFYEMLSAITIWIAVVGMVYVSMSNTYGVFISVLAVIFAAYGTDMVTSVGRGRGKQ